MTRKQYLLTGVAVAAAAAFALAAPAAWAAVSDSDSASATATVVEPITVTTDGVALAFGSFEPGTGGTVVVTQAGVASVTGNVIRVPGSANTTSAAGFDVTGEALFVYDIAATTLGLTNTTGLGAETMALSLDAPLTGTLSAAPATDAFAVGGTLTVVAAQTPGVYTGTVTVVVTYQ